MKTEIQNILKGKVVIVGIGNSMKGDDGFGPALIERLNNKTSFSCLNADTSPENYIGKITKEDPDTILLVDAVHMNLDPGEYRVLEKKDIQNSGLTTHNLSPAMFIEFLENETKASIYMLGIQPKTVSLGEELSEEMKATLENIIKKIASGGLSDA